MYKRLLIFILFIHYNLLLSQVQFSRGNSIYKNGRSHYSGVAGGFTDLDGDFMDDLIVLDKSRILEVGINNGVKQEIKWLNKLVASATAEYSIVAIDIENDGIKEIISAGPYTDTKIFSIKNETLQIRQNITNSIYAQAANIVDINNDGYLDYFVCHDEGNNSILINDKKGSFIKSNLINFNTLPPSDNSGNYGSEWADVDNDGDLDLYIAKCKFGVKDEEDPRRHNMLFINDNGLFKNEAELRGLKDKGQSWTGSFADYDNDGDSDCLVTNHDRSHVLYDNDGKGYFKENTHGINFGKSFAFQSFWQDMDNNGFLDLLIFGDDVTEIHYNTNGKSFIKSSLPFSQTVINSASIGDINNDGFWDIAAYYGEGINLPSTQQDELFINNKNNNNYIKIALKGILSNTSGIGAKIISFGSWGKQLREVHSGVSYGISNSLNQIIGLGKETKLDSLMIVWPSGKVDKYYNLASNQFVIATEGRCLKPLATVNPQKTFLCSNDSVSIKLSTNLSNIKWNNGAIGNEIFVKKAGKYYAQSKSPDGCFTQSNVIYIQDGNNEKLLNSYKDSLFVCEPIQLVTNNKFSNLKWSTSDTSKTIVVSNSSKISISALNGCLEKVYDSLVVTVINTNLTPKDLYINKNQDTSLIAQGEEITWYDEKGKLIQTGNILKLKNVENSTKYFATNKVSKGIKTYSIGENNIPTTGNIYSSDIIDAGLYLNIFKASKILSLDVGSDKEGIRRFLIINEAGDTIFKKDFMIKALPSQSLTINASLPPGINYQFKTDEKINKANLGFNGPRLTRIQESTNYPYDIEGIMEIPSSYRGANGYYYFFNIKIADEGTTCISDKVPFNIFVDKTNILEEDPTSLKIYPNPASNQLNIKSNFDDVLLAYNAVGQLVFRRNVVKGINTFNIDLPRGFYKLKLQSHSHISRKIVIQ
jgi:hypothetical protein